MYTPKPSLQLSIPMPGSKSPCKPKPSTSSSSLSSLLLCTRERHRPLRRGFSLMRPTIFPPKYRPKDKHHEIDPGDRHPLTPRDTDFPLSLLPLVTDLQEVLWVIRNHTIDFLVYAPSHHGWFVDRPHVQRPAFRFHIANKACSKERQHKGLL